MRHKIKKLGLKTFAATAVLGTVAQLSLGAATSVSAAPLYAPYGRQYSYATSKGETIDDNLGPLTINGQWVWCIEPFVLTAGGYEYFSTGDITQGTRLSRNPKSGVTTTLSNNQKQIAALFPWLILNAPMSVFDTIAESGRASNDDKGKGFAAQVDKVKRTVERIRKEPDYVRYSTVQFFYWQFVLDNNGVNQYQSPRSIRQSTKSIPGILAPAPMNMINEVNEALVLWNDRSLATNDTPWLMTSYHWALHGLNYALNNDIIQYEGGVDVYESNNRTIGQNLPAQRMVMAANPRVTVKQDGYVTVDKSIISLKDNVALSKNPEAFTPYDWTGVKVGLYSNAEGTGTPLHTFTFNKDGKADVFKTKPGTYYMYELDANGQPVKSDAQKVIAGEKFYRSGRFADSKNFSTSVNVTTQNTQSNPAKKSLLNTPVVTGFELKKTSSNEVLPEIDPKAYTLEGAQYQLFYDAAATDPVKRKDGSNIIGTTNKDGLASFTDLAAGRYYVKEIKAPVITNQEGKQVSPYKVNPKITPVDLTSTNFAETGTQSDGTDAAFKVVNVKLNGQILNAEDEELTPGDPGLTKFDKQTGKQEAVGKQATLKGAEFEIKYLSVADGSVRKTLKFVTQDNGTFDILNWEHLTAESQAQFESRNKFEKFKEGAYHLEARETKAPAGYLLSREVKKITASQAELESEFILSDNGEFAFGETRLDLNVLKVQDKNNVQTQDIALKDAEFTLRRTDGGVNYTETVKSDANGKLSFKGLAPGVYELSETKAPKGYQLNTQKVNVTIKDNNNNADSILFNNQSVETDQNGSYKIEWGNERIATNGLEGNIDVGMENKAMPADFKLVKRNEKGAPLANAEFTLQREAANGKTYDPVKVRTNDQGEINLEDQIKVDTWYTLVESKAPEGYKLPQVRKTVRFRVHSIPAKNDFKVEYAIDELDQYDATNKTEKKGQLSTFGGTETTAEKSGISYVNTNLDDPEVTFQMVNNTWKKLPATGSKATLYVAAGTTALIALGMGISLYLRKREEEA